MTSEDCYMIETDIMVYHDVDDDVKINSFWMMILNLLTIKVKQILCL
jgi:hypothetical protein